MSHEHPKFQRDDQGNLFLNFGSYGAEVEVAAISRDGRRLLTVKEVGVAVVWDLDSGEEVASIRPTSPLEDDKDASPFSDAFVVFIESAALNADGSMALLGLNDGTAVVYSTANATQQAVLHQPDTKPGSKWSVIRSVAYSPDGSLALVGFPGRAVGVWSADGSRPIAFLTPPEPDERVGRPTVRGSLTSAVAASDDGRLIFGGAANMTACAFELSTGKVLLDAREHAQDIIALFDGPAGIGWATTGGAVWCASDGPIAQKVLDTGEHWSEVVFDSRRMLARTFDDKVSLWDFDGRKTQVSTPKAQGMWSDRAKTLWLSDNDMFFPDGGRCVSLHLDGGTTVVERDEQLIRAELSPSRDLLATDGWADELQLWDVETGDMVHCLPCPGGSGCFAFSPDGTQVATGETGHGGGLYERAVYVYDTHSGARLHKLDGHEWQVRQVAFSSSGRLLASIGDDLVVWDLSALGASGGKPLLCVPLERTTGAVVFAGDKLIAVDRGRCQIFDGAEQILSFEVPIGFQTPWILSKDGRHLLVGGNQAVFRFDLANGRLERSAAADIPRPEHFPPLSLEVAREARVGAMLWWVEGTPFLHQGDGPRGWVQPLVLSNGMAAVPTAEGAAVLMVESQSARVVGRVDFSGRLRASAVVGNEVLLVNEEGRLYRASTQATPGQPDEIA